MEVVESELHRPHIPASQNIEWGSPPDLVAELASEFGPFDLDVAASDELHVCSNYFTKEMNGLALPWFGQCYCNPPYGEEGVWVHKAIVEVAVGRAARVVFLIPSKTSTGWWHQLVEPYAATVRFLKGRRKFVGAPSCAPFASAVVVFEGR